VLGDAISFRGREIVEDGRGLEGNLIVDKRFSGGAISGEIEFTKHSPPAVCELSLYYALGSQRMVMERLGAGLGMFAVRHFNGERWSIGAARGDHSHTIKLEGYIDDEGPIRIL
jgi:hypothetical protein